MKETVLKKNGAELKFRPDSGKYSIRCGSFELKDLQPLLLLEGKAHPLRKWEIVKENANSLSARTQAGAEYGEWMLKFKVESSGTLTAELSGKLRAPCEDIGLFYFRDAELPVDHVLSQALTMGGCESIPAKQARGKEFASYLQTVFTRKGESLRLSFPIHCEHIPSVRGKVSKGRAESLSAGSEIRHFSGKNIRLEPLSFRAGDGFQLLRDYADENVKETRDFSRIAVPGWNSWDYYRWTVTEDAVLENAEFIAADPVLSRHVKRIIVDDGWQYCYGEWEANHFFPHGMKFLAEKIRKLGFVPGLWIAPVIVEPHSWIAQMEYAMMAKGESGHPTLCFDCMRRKGFLLDPTVEKSRRFLAELFDRYARDGYGYFKLDFLNAVLRAPQFTDKSIPRGKIMQLIVKTIRDAVAGRADILGCNYGYNGGPELVEAVRVGGDIHAVWESIKSNTVSVAARFWSNKKLWVNDPDFALCRAFDTSDDPNLTRLQPSLVFIEPESTDVNHPGLFRLVDIHRAQAEVLLSLVIAAGGAVNLSDRMPLLNESGLDLARRTVSAESGDAAVPLDLFVNPLPKYWIQKVGGARRVLLINWEDSPAELTLNLEKNGLSCRKAVNFWNDREIPVRNGSISAELAPRSCLFAVLEA